MGRRRNKRTVGPKRKTTKKVSGKQTTQISLSKPPKPRQTKLSFASAANDSRTNAQGGARIELLPAPKRGSLAGVVVSPPSNHSRCQYSPGPFPKLSIIQPQALFPRVNEQPRLRLRLGKQKSRRRMVRNQVHLHCTGENGNVKVE